MSCSLHCPFFVIVKRRTLFRGRRRREDDRITVSVFLPLITFVQFSFLLQFTMALVVVFPSFLGFCFIDDSVQ